jgi:glycosyltransferase involved in cell wall biosynthesis
MVDRLPLVTIGLPVHNGEKFLRQALDSALAQDYGNLEFVLINNASTDGTAKICEEYAARDRRIRYESFDQLVIAPENFYRAVKAATGKYFTWLSHDDLLSNPQCISQLVPFLEANRDTICCAPGVAVIDIAGFPIKEQLLKEIYPEEPWTEARRKFFQIQTSNIYLAISGLFRREALLQVRIEPRRFDDQIILAGLEYLFLARLACLGRIVGLPFVGRSQRKRPDSYWHLERKNINLPLKRKVDAARDIQCGLLRVIAHSQLPFAEKVQLWRVALGNFRIGETLTRPFKKIISRLAKAAGVARSKPLPQRKADPGWINAPVERYIELHFPPPAWEKLPAIARQSVINYHLIFARYRIGNIVIAAPQPAVRARALDEVFPGRNYHLLAPAENFEALAQACAGLKIFSAVNLESFPLPHRLDALLERPDVGLIDMLVVDLPDDQLDVWVGGRKVLTLCQIVVVRLPRQTFNPTAPDANPVFQLLTKLGFFLHSAGEPVENAEHLIESIEAIFVRE